VIPLPARERDWRVGSWVAVRWFSAVCVAVLVVVSGCRHFRPSEPWRSEAAALPADALAPSPRLIVGWILAVDLPRGFAFIDLASDTPPRALADGAGLTSRTQDLRETGQLRVSHHRRGRTLGTTIVSGQPSPGDEVVWLAP
jgi:hypothetical protein